MSNLKEEATISTFEGHIKMIVIQLEELGDKYNESQNKDHNSEYFRGKSEAYKYAAKEIKNCLKWHGKIS